MIAGILKNIREKDKIQIVLILAFLLGAFLHFRNLHDARYLDPDEARAFTLLSSGSMLYFLCRPLFLIMDTESSGFYTAAVFGFGSIVLFYLISHKVFSDKRTAVATLVYAVFPIRINFARSLYPAVFADFFILLLILVIVNSFLHKRKRYMVLAGLCSVALIFVHPFTYAVLLALCLTSFLLWISNSSSPRLYELMTYFTRFLLGALTGYFLLESLVAFTPGGFVFTEALFDYHSEVASVAGIQKSSFLPLLDHMARIIFSSGLYFFRSLFIFMALLLALSGFGNRKKDPLFYFAFYGAAGLLILFIASVLRFHELFLRSTVWFCAVISWCIGSLVVSSGSWRKKSVSAVTKACFVMFVSSSIALSYLVTNEMFKTSMINEWLASNGISKGQIVTYIHLYQRGDEMVPTLPPVTKHPSWKITDHKYQIVWPLVFTAYLTGQVKYIMPSGMGAHVRLGENDPFLEGVMPLKSWVHPYSLFRYRVFHATSDRSEESEVKYINFYRISDIHDRAMFMSRGE